MKAHYSLYCWLLCSFLLFSSCASGLKRTRHPLPSPAPKSGRTVLFFLVDGLAVKTLKTGLQSGQMPNFQKFFLPGGMKFAVAQASFPTLTYPNISSVLTTRAIGEQPVISNHVVAPSGLVLNYEKAEFHPLLRATIDPISVIGELNDQGKETASFSYVFGMNAGSHMRIGVREGLEYQKHNYQSLDARSISSLDRFLGEREAHEWPEFIYVHLVGVDGFSHMFGPSAPETQAYLAWLDSQIGAVFQDVVAGEAAGQDIVTMLTADHGFVTTERHLGLAKVLRKADLGLVITNESRFLGLHLPSGASPNGLRKALKETLRNPGVEFTALKTGNIFELSNGRIQFRFAMGPPVCGDFPVSLALLPPRSRIVPAASFRCPTDFDDSGSRTYPLLVSQLARFLTAPQAPDALVIAKPDVSFTGGARGNHGGPTADESFVPVLLRNATLRPTGALHSYDLLKFLRARAGT